MAAMESLKSLSDLIAQLDAAMEPTDGRSRCYRVKQVLENAGSSAQLLLSDRHRAPDQNRYARNLVHIDPHGRYSVIAMVWGPGQGTPIHDHDNMWCCECVMEGKIKVVSYQLVGSLDEDFVDFTPELELFAGPGEAGALIPPYDHHTIENALADENSITLHVYGGEMKHCHVFVPAASGGFQRVERELCYTTS